MGPAALIPILGPIIGTLIDRLVPDKAAAEKLKVEAETMLVETAAQANMAQVEANKVEAAHASVFVAGWRPFLGWGLTAMFLWAIGGAALVGWAAQWLDASAPPMPAIDTDRIEMLLYALLGLAGLRTAERWKGVAASPVGPKPPAPRPK